MAARDEDGKRAAQVKHASIHRSTNATDPPSLTLLDICRQRVDTADRAAPRRPLALLDPTGDLPMTRLDGLAIHPTPDSGRILTGANATSGRWADAARDADPCHYAGHAAYSRDDPLESRIELADGALVLGSLFDEHVPVPAGGNVVLSGCETAMTDHTEPADEHLGIASGFLFAGSAAVLSTQWAVAEAPAAILVDQYYTHLRRDEPARALRIAQRALRKASRADLAHLLDRADRLAGMDVLDERTRQRLRTDRQALRGTRIDYSHPVHWAAYTATGYTPPGPDDQVTNRHTTT
ncbi:hypothetical protein DMB66_56480 [Actinoplanes sp. ATCC 53533]|uniref:CHAT domain-containing protein n=1 Tax=Actinoplanes sp. ATCC 53533 TaxID=1288362 RepID=UPI000F770031|nr:CHAT domain-containing protein [Actinoplanes sp. ATCC 53533]RSM41126.1 hypothetical protein DMB66_56480 [Actinoplanes sp. ATCC 53533]